MRTIKVFITPDPQCCPYCGHSYLGKHPYDYIREIDIFFCGGCGRELWGVEKIDTLPMIEERELNDAFC